MSLRWYSAVIKSRDHRGLASWWAEAIGWRMLFDTENEVVLVPPWAEELGPQLSFEQVPPGLVFVPVEHDKGGKNRLHFDFAPHVGQDRGAEIERLLYDEPDDGPKLTRIRIQKRYYGEIEGSGAVEVLTPPEERKTQEMTQSPPNTLQQRTCFATTTT